MIDLDVQKFFDTVSWDLVVRAVQAVTDCPWVLLYVKRWLAAPLQRPDGTLVQRDKGTRRVGYAQLRSAPRRLEADDVRS